MIQVLLEQVTLWPGPCQWDKYKLDVALDRIAVHTVAAVVATVCVLLLIRTSTGTLHSRFLRHLAVSIGLVVVYRVGSIVDLLLHAGLGFVAGRVGPNDPEAESMCRALTTLESTWHGIDVTISLLASFFLLTTWHLLRGYPDQNVSRSFYTWLNAILGTLVGVVSLIATLQKPIWLALDVLDVSCATGGLWLVGWQIQKTLGPRIQTKNAVVRAILPLATLLAYLFWGGLQPFYYWPKDLSWYSIMLTIVGLTAIILTIMLCAQSLESRPEYVAVEPAPGSTPQVGSGTSSAGVGGAAGLLTGST